MAKNKEEVRLRREKAKLPKQKKFNSFQLKLQDKLKRKAQNQSNVKISSTKQILEIFRAQKEKVLHNLALEAFKELPVIKGFEEEAVLEIISPTT